MPDCLRNSARRAPATVARICSRACWRCPTSSVSSQLGSSRRASALRSSQLTNSLTSAPFGISSALPGPCEIDSSHETSCLATPVGGCRRVAGRVTMAAVMGPQLSSAPPPPPVVEGPKRRRWVIGGIVAGWIVVLAVVATWSVWHSPATVPEQRDIADAVPELQRAAGVVYAAAGRDKRVVLLGELELIGDCRITPVRHGYVAARDLTVYVRQGEAEAALAGIADALPESYQAGVAVTRGGTRVGLHADAGNFIGIDSG